MPRDVVAWPLEHPKWKALTETCTQRFRKRILCFAESWQQTSPDNLFVLKVVIMITFGFIDRNGVFGIRRKPLFFPITPVKFYVQQMLLVKVISENVAKVRYNHHNYNI